MLKMSACEDSSDCLNDIITDVVISDLATKLKKQCYDNGVEIEPKESAKTLHQLGLEYKEKSPDKISLIQSVALMTSAVLRHPDNADDIRKDLDDVCLHIMTLAGVSHPDTELMNKAVAEIKEQIQTFRENTIDKLDELKPMSDDLKGEKLNAIRKQRVVQVNKIQDFVTETYKNIMRLIAKHTFEIMGKAPCRFALVGMGSLAKNEVTPYSDFESIIVLEEGIQKQPNYKYVLQYFEWFATVYQTILVRLGETLLRFLAIPCLNSPSNKEEDWFYDAHTPCGICPDGFAPQASKNPLGRQTKTENKPWTTELIKPVSEMVKYLDTEEDLKNGYHLADMLTTTCFVFGDFAVSEQFQSKIEQKLNQMIKFNQRLQLNIGQDFELFQIGTIGLIDKVDVKRVALRSCSLFIFTLGRLHKCKSFTCFKVLKELVDRRVMNKTLHDKLQFSMTVACEMRLRWYSKTSGQNDILLQPMQLGQPSRMEKLTEEIGKKAVVDGLNISASLQKFVVKCFEEEMLQEAINRTPIPPSLQQYGFEWVAGESKKIIDFEETPLMAAWVARMLYLYRFALNLTNECMKSHQNISAKDWRDLHVSQVICLLHCGDAEKCLEVCKEEITRLNSPDLYDIRCLYIKQCYRSLIVLERYEEALEYSKTLFKTHTNEVKTVTEVEINASIGKGYLSTGNYEKARYYLELAYNEEQEKPSKALIHHRYEELLIDYSRCLNFLYFHNDALLVNEELLTLRRKMHVHEETDYNLYMAYLIKGDSLLGLKRYKEALVYIDKIWKSKVIVDAQKTLHNRNYVFRKIECLIKLGRASEAKFFVEHVWQEKIELLFRKNREMLPGTGYSEFCSFVYEILKDQLKCKKPNDVIKLAKKSLHFSFHSGDPNTTETSINIICVLIEILLGLQRYDECLAAAKQGIQLCQFVYDHCHLEEKFVKIFKMSEQCELKFAPTVPYHDTPSMFHYAQASIPPEIDDLYQMIITNSNEFKPINLVTPNSQAVEQ